MIRLQYFVGFIELLKMLNNYLSVKFCQHEYSSKTTYESEIRRITTKQIILEQIDVLSLIHFFIINFTSKMFLILSTHQTN